MLIRENMNFSETYKEEKVSAVIKQLWSNILTI